MQKSLFLLSFLAFTFGAYSQNIGIGTATPQSKLGVHGNLAIGTAYSNLAAPANGAIIEGTLAIGTAAPDLSAALHINAPNKGLLIPNVSLSDISVFGLAGASNTESILLYNTNASLIGGNGKGFYYWTGTQ